MFQLPSLFPIVLVSLCASLAGSPLLIRLAPRLGLIDLPGSQPHKWHVSATPMAGGMAVALALLVSYLTTVPGPSRQVWAILAAGGVVFIWGLWDDRANLPA